MSAVSKAYSAISDFNTWIKIKSGDSLTLADVPSIIKLRIKDIVRDWEQIRNRIIILQSGYPDRARLQRELDKFSEEVDTLRVRPDALNSVPESDLLSKYYTVFESMRIDDMPLTSQEQVAVRSEITRIMSLTLNSFRDMRETVISGRDAIADAIGGSDATYNTVFSRSSEPKTLNKNTQRIQACVQFQYAINALTDIIANSTSIFKTASIDPFALARANANNPNININSYRSGKLSKLNYGESLETLALRTMGNGAKWVEIAIANGLKPPYIDEVGEKVFLISNGKNNTINISKTDKNGRLNIEKVYINQVVILQSNARRPPDQRIITSIREIPASGEIIIELDGESNLDIYRVADYASVRVFKPNTINSNFYVLIPSNEQPANQIQTQTPWFLTGKGQDEKNAMVDILLGKNNDLSFTSSGDLQLSYGIDNGTQALNVLLSTVKGSRPLHPNYGIVNTVGSAIGSDGAAKEISDSISQQVLNDPRFDRLEFMTVESIVRPPSGGPLGYIVNLGVVLAGGGNKVIPISFQVDT